MHGEMSLHACAPLHAGSREGLYGGALSQQQLTGAMLMGGAAGVPMGVGERGYQQVSRCSPTAIAVASTCHR